MKKITCLLILLLATRLGFGQIKLAEITFENPGGYTTDILEFTDYVFPPNSSDGRDYFIRTDGSNIRGETFFNIQGSYYFTAQDIDGEGASLPARLSINDVNISGYSNIEFRIYLAEDDLNTTSEHWDNSDYVHINYDIDNSGTFANLLWIESTGTNTEPRIDTDFDGIGDGIAITDTFAQFTENIAGQGNVLDIEIVFQLNAAQEDIAIDNIEIWGTRVPCSGVASWNGSSWAGGVLPDISKTVELNGNYDTSSNGSFSACDLNVNSGTLDIGDGDFVEVQNDLNVSGDIILRPQGAFVQNNEFGTITNTGTIIIEKETAPANNWYEYTYWSSPVQGARIDNGLTEAQANRRFEFNAENFLDHCAETANNNICDDNGGVGLQDDIDDDNNDWQPVGDATIMMPGVGYASTHDRFIFNSSLGSPPKRFVYLFEGPFNNGVIDVAVYRNDYEVNDNNWNLIGNPYPSAIDADLFLAANNGIVDAIFLWSQNTPPSSTVNGNQVLNFSDSDYAIINGTGETQGGDDVNGDGIVDINDKPSRFIPSCQAFFVSYSDTATPVSTYTNGDSHTIAQGYVSFNNSMRVFGTTDNALFFKSSNSKNEETNALENKLWVNLTSDNGVFNQILIGYVNGATESNDGMYYDAVKNLSSSSSAIIYSLIANSEKKFAIQGKATTSLTEDETIKLGFKTSIDVATLYTFSIAQLQGDFLTQTPVYLKDNLLNKLHNLSDADYSFTSEIGEFNGRFEIVFKSNALSTDDVTANSNHLTIVQLGRDNVKFSTESSTIKSVAIFDLLGRQLYDLKGKASTETYSLPNLKNSIYIAKVRLSDGTIITKKAVKK